MKGRKNSTFQDFEIQKFINMMNDQKISLARGSKKHNSTLTSKNAGGFYDFCKSFYGKISYAIMPFILFLSVLVFTYFGNQLIFEMSGGVGGSDYPHIPLDNKIPLIS